MVDDFLYVCDDAYTRLGFSLFVCFLKLGDIQGPVDEDGEEDALRGGLRPGMLLVLQVGGVFQYL